jgi:hypothetical protein
MAPRVPKRADLPLSMKSIAYLAPPTAESRCGAAVIVEDTRVYEFQYKRTKIYWFLETSFVRFLKGQWQTGLPFFPGRHGNEEAEAE